MTSVEHSHARRRFLGAATAASSLFIASRAAGVTQADLFTTVDTAQGRLRGLNSGGIAVFKGVRYGADTTGANRFLAPQPVTPWAGIRDATAYGNYAPQVPADRRNAYSDLIMYDRQPGGMGEDCLVMNIWTPSASTSARLPVLVHLHGGGFYAGSGNSPQFDGEMLARFGHAVVITVNHRIGAFGFLNLAQLGGERYAQSGMAGMLDISAALAYLKENVAVFGGDPSRVLVFGQSGGGMKTAVLLAMPAAEGLFQRAGVMSGPILETATVESSDKATDTFLNILGVDRGSLGKLESLPMADLLAAQATMEDAERKRGEAPHSFVPVVNGSDLPRQPFAPDASPVGRAVPTIFGTTLDERAYRKANFNLDEAGLLSYAQGAVGQDAEQVVAMYRQEDAAATPFVLQARIDSDMTFHKIIHKMADRKAAAGGAPTWAYLWKTPSPAYGGRYGAPHGIDIGPSMHDIRNGLNGPSEENLRLADQLASAWVSFAASGDPNNAKTPGWPAYMLPARKTLVFEGDSAHTHVVDDPRQSFRTFWESRS